MIGAEDSPSVALLNKFLNKFCSEDILDQTEKVQFLILNSICKISNELSELFCNLKTDDFYCKDGSNFNS